MLRFTRRSRATARPGPTATTTESSRDQAAYEAAINNLPVIPGVAVVVSSSNEPESTRKEEPRMMPG